MNNKFINFLKKYFLMIIFFMVFCMGGASTTYAGTTDNIFGNAWSNNLGWISFNNCENPGVAASCNTVNYGVKTTITGVVSGYAWNDNVGWISFNPTDWGTCPPSGGCTSIATYTNTWASGWARALSMKIANTNDGGADGWIHFSNGSPAYSATMGSTNVAGSMGNLFSGVGTVVHSVTGYWWGSKVIGWIDLSPDASYSTDAGGVFDCVTCNIPPVGPTVTLTPSSTSVLSGNTLDFSWSVSPNTFIPVKCEGVGGPANNTDWNGVNFGNGTSATGINVRTATTSSISTNFSVKCMDASSQVAVSSAVAITTVPLTPTMSYGGSCMQNGGTPTVSWSVNDASATCRIEATPSTGSTYYYPTGGAYNLTGTVSSSGTSGTFTDANFSNVTTSYKLSCTNGSGAYLTSRISSPPASATMCTPNYGISVYPSCTPLVKSGTGKTAVYSADASLTVTPQNGFVSNINASASATVGTATLNPSSFTYANGIYNTVLTHMSIPEATYNTIVGMLIPPNSVVSTATVSTSGVAQNTNIKNTSVDFCTANYVPPFITVSPTPQLVASGDTSATVSVNSNTNWSTIISYPAGVTPWIIGVSPSTGSNIGVLGVTFSSNLSALSRSAFIKVVDSSNSTIFDIATITQDGTICLDNISLSSNSENVTDASGTISTVNVTTNVSSWTEVSSDKWLQTNPSSSLFTPTYDQNTDPTSRTATIYITAGCANATYTVNQLGTKPEIHISPLTQSSYNASYTGPVSPFTVFSNVTWTLTLDDNWVDDPGMYSIYGIFTFPININSPNILPVSRDIHVKVTDDNDPANFDTATITQDGICFGIGCGDYITLNSIPTILSTDTAATVVLNSNANWIIDVAYPSFAWINSITPSSGANTTTLTLNFNTNTFSLPRFADITATDIFDPSVTSTITVIQDASCPGCNYIYTSPVSMCIDSPGGNSTISVNSNTSWSANSNQAWLTVNTPSGVNSGAVSIYSDPNGGGTPRTGTVTVTDGGSNTATVNITQNDSGTICTVNTGATLRPKYIPN